MQRLLRAVDCRQAATDYTVSQGITVVCDLTMLLLLPAPRPPREETAVVSALKRQLTQYGDIADRYAATSRETDMEPGMKEVMDKVARLFNGQVGLCWCL